MEYIHHYKNVSLDFVPWLSAPVTPWHRDVFNTVPIHLTLPSHSPATFYSTVIVDF